MLDQPEAWTSVARWALVFLLIGIYFMLNLSHSIIFVSLLLNISLLFREALWGYLMLIALSNIHGCSVYSCNFCVLEHWFPTILRFLLLHRVVTWSFDLFVICLFARARLFSPRARGICIFPVHLLCCVPPFALFSLRFCFLSLGQDFVVKYSMMHGQNSKEWKFLCLLCGRNLGTKESTAHVLSYEHAKNFLVSLKEVKSAFDECGNVCGWWLVEAASAGGVWLDSGAGWGCTPVVHWVISVYRLDQPSPHTLGGDLLHGSGAPFPFRLTLL